MRQDDISSFLNLTICNYQIGRAGIISQKRGIESNFLSESAFMMKEYAFFSSTTINHLKIYSEKKTATCKKTCYRSYKPSSLSKSSHYTASTPLNPPAFRLEADQQRNPRQRSIHSPRRFQTLHIRQQDPNHLIF